MRGSECLPNFEETTLKFKGNLFYEKEKKRLEGVLAMKRFNEKGFRLNVLTYEMANIFTVEKMIEVGSNVWIKYEDWVGKLRFQG